MVIRARKSTYADAHLVFLDSKQPDELYGLIENFRQYIHLPNLGRTKGRKHAVFPTTKSEDKNASGALFQSQS